MQDFKGTIKNIITKFTQESTSVFSQKIFSEAGEFGIGEGIVNENLKLLKEENFIYEPIPGVLKRY